MNRPILARVRLGALAFGISAVLFAGFPLVRPFFPPPHINAPTEVTAASQAYITSSWVVAHYMAMMAFVLLMYGLLTLHTCLANHRGERRAFVGLIVALAGIALTLPTLGVETYALPVLGRVYLDGKTEVAPVVGLIHSGGFVVLVLGLSFLAIGAIFLAIAIWSSAILPKWAGILLTAGLAFWFPLFPQMIRIGDGLLIGVGGLWLAWTMWRRSGGIPLNVTIEPIEQSGKLA